MSVDLETLLSSFGVGFAKIVKSYLQMRFGTTNILEILVSKPTELWMELEKAFQSSEATETLFVLILSEAKKKGFVTGEPIMLLNAIKKGDLETLSKYIKTGG